jgi:hypothetical protein
MDINYLNNNRVGKVETHSHYTTQKIPLKIFIVKKINT